MVMIKAIVRPEKVDNVLEELMAAGFPAVTKLSVHGRGKQRGIKIGNVVYDELPKELLLIAVKDSERDLVIKTIIRAARTGDKGAFGDGKIFVAPLEEAYTISSAIRELPDGRVEEVKL
ncbi:P-II family nitrogen regulator [Spirochaeta thermophila]|uniref:Transcriptional regulatory protein n=1 Tax=Winmispira thermophila (strain ATCC 49972 / DSM 6192 / RI 19.B1) TaxID=665571 RepID=E0RPD1_WINT6|nr:P-II family nitrogen regulator [Spirochaeta thermophila]ADN01325.1 transcriptional regulatory protein [Spirochaeta thermophila DSM 6192]